MACDCIQKDLCIPVCVCVCVCGITDKLVNVQVLSVFERGRGKSSVTKEDGVLLNTQIAKPSVSIWTAGG